jgi:hypothetical protein
MGTGTASNGAPAEGTLVPANIPAVATVPGTYSGTPCQVTWFELLDPNGAPVATSPSPSEPGVHLLDQALVPGQSHLLRYEHLCSHPQAQPLTFQQSFSVGVAAPLPTSTGTLTIAEQGAGPFTVSDGSCGWSGTSAWVLLQITPSCELMPFLPVVSFTTEVDGQPWASSRIGSTDWVSGSSRQMNLIFAQCSAYPANYGTTAGSHLVSIRAHIAGSAVELQPATLPITLGCAGSSDELVWGDPLDLAGACAPDAGRPTVDAGTDGNVSSDAGAAPVDATVDVGEDDAAASSAPDGNAATPSLEARGGCQIARPTGQRGFEVGALLLMLLLVNRRRPIRAR